MTKLEKTINQLISEKERLTNLAEKQKISEYNENKKKQEYVSEFNNIYDKIKDIDIVKSQFIIWANSCKIDDYLREITDGSGFYDHLLHEAKSCYQKYGEKGYESWAAFDKGTEVLIEWIIKSRETNPEGTIYLNHSPAFLHRLRHMGE